MESSGLSGLSGNELASHSDFSDNEATVRLPAASFESLSASAPRAPPLSDNIGAGAYPRASPLNRSSSHQSTAAAELDPDRVIWQGWLYHLRTKGGVRQWKHLWGVLRPRNLIL
ncbi:putative PH domain-containing protein PB16A4.02c-like protein [Emericellopsis cladophorae]|uniref:PH domain-containing protein PB16A4.02c-like protein n=1 Tax=Emericellopsis cladophorae TaxID=2686198 RepID=A0A9P9XTV6_9HYPO|nr:putative PH domain-containing protein PB16A4.02c-like protein [Emericellopsis cladophorae]KAI6777721.1 putative PH domain-containing protein PB16A4.02c-like protein [Emericellopsis cladophorae]